MGYISTQTFDNSHMSSTLLPSEFIHRTPQANDIRLREQYRITKPHRQPVITNGMPPRIIQPKGSSQNPMSSSQSSSSPAHICLCQPTPKIPRPRNAFILFRQHHHSAVMNQNPGKSNPAISKIIGNMWKNAPEDTRREWQNHADEEKRQHMARYPDYRYQPRRSIKKGGIQSPSEPTSEPTICAKCGGRTGAHSIADPPQFPILPVPKVSAPSASGGLSRSGSLKDLLGPSPSLFSRHPSPGENKRKRMDEVEYHHGAEALLQLGSHEREFPSRTTSPAMSYQGDLPLPLSYERRASDPPNYKPLLPAAFAPEYREPQLYSNNPQIPGLVNQSLPNLQIPLQQHRYPSVSEHHRHQLATSTLALALPPTDKIQQIQRITRPLSNRSLTAASTPGQFPLTSLSLGRTFLIAVEVTDNRLARELSFVLYSEFLERFRNVGVQQIMDIPEWDQFLQRSSAASPEDLASDYLRAVAAARRQFETMVMAAANANDRSSGGALLLGPSASSTVATPSLWDTRTHSHSLGFLGAQLRPPPPPPPPPLPPMIITILQQYIYTHSGTAKRKLSPDGNISPVYTSEWCVDVWRGSPQPNVTVIVRNDDGLGAVKVEEHALGLISIPAPTGNGGLEGRPWKVNIIKRLALEIMNFITNRHGIV